MSDSEHCKLVNCPTQLVPVRKPSHDEVPIMSGMFLDTNMDLNTMAEQLNQNSSVPPQDKTSEEKTET